MSKRFPPRRYLIFLSSILGPLTTNAIIPLFEPLRANFSLATISQVSLAISFYIFPFALFQLFGGTFSDVVDKKKVMILGYIIFIGSLLTSLLAIFIRVYWLFLLAFFIQGIGFSFINPTVLAILSIITPEEKEGAIMGVFNSSAGIGISLGSFIAGLLVSLAGGWRYLFIINPIISTLSLFLFLYGIKGCEDLICKPYELSPPEGSPEERSFLGKTLTQFKENLTREILLLGIIGFLCFFTVITLTNTLGEQMMVALPNVSDKEIVSIVSLTLTINGLISIFMSPVTGYVLKKISPLIMMFIGFIFLLAVIGLPLAEHIPTFMVLSFLIYIGSVFIWPSLFKSAMDLNPTAKGTNSAIINSLRFLGYASVGPFYVLIGIPTLFMIVIILDILGIGILILINHLRKSSRKKIENKRKE
ncbi:MAG: MFS transporter [Promethearchaeia archaeon]